MKLGLVNFNKLLFFLEKYIIAILPPINCAIIVAIAMSKPEEIADTFTKLENIWDEYEVYDK